MIPYELNKILQPLGSILKVLLIIMLLCGLVLSEDSCNPWQRVKAKKLSYIHGNYLGVQNRSVVTTIEETRTLYTITDTDIKSTAVFIFDPQAKRFICMVKRKRGAIKFVAKVVPKPKMCMFKEVAAVHGYVNYELASDPKIKLTVNNKQNNRQNNRRNTRHNRHKAEDRFSVITDWEKCRSSTKDFCNYIRSKHNMPKKIRDVC